MKVEYKFPLTHAMTEIGRNGDNPLTRYPNLFAEWAASSYHLWVLCEHANVSHEVMLAVLYKEESMLAAEAFRLSGLFNVPLDYLFSSDLRLLTGEDLQEAMDRLMKKVGEIADKLDSAEIASCQNFELKRELARVKRLQNADIATCAEVSRCFMELKDILHSLDYSAPRTTLIKDEERGEADDSITPNANLTPISGRI